jgi:ABC-type glutathione transport system ATPase component
MFESSDEPAAEVGDAVPTEAKHPARDVHPADMPDTAAGDESGDGDLVVRGVSKRFRTGRTDVHALDDVNLHVRPGEFVCLLGPSGCGKSTLLDIIAGLTKPDEGDVRADGQLVVGPHRHRLVMFQESALFPWLNTVAQRDVRPQARARPDKAAAAGHRPKPSPPRRSRKIRASQSA